MATRYVLAEYAIAGLCLAAAVLDAMASRWLTAAFSLLNAGLFIYGIQAFIGMRESWDDIRSGWAIAGKNGSDMRAGHAGHKP